MCCVYIGIFEIKDFDISLFLLCWWEINFVVCVCITALKWYLWWFWNLFITPIIITKTMQFNYAIHMLVMALKWTYKQFWNNKFITYFSSLIRCFKSLLLKAPVEGSCGTIFWAYSERRWFSRTPRVNYAVRSDEKADVIRHLRRL